MDFVNQHPKRLKAERLHLVVDGFWEKNNIFN